MAGCRSAERHPRERSQQVDLLMLLLVVLLLVVTLSLVRLVERL
jgi:hypothetical protein